ncbi:MAG: DinB family protein [Acidimicrobiales bacterium]
MTDTWRAELLEQLEFYWDTHLWPRLNGLTDDEYFWEPVGGCWSLRRGSEGDYELEQFAPDPPLPPVTTIAWRVVHVGRDIFGTRARALFGPTSAPDDAHMYDKRHWPEPLPGTAAGGLALLAEAYTLWHDGVAGLCDDDLRQPIGPKGEEFAEDSMAQLALHINREVMVHGAEICLLRDLYRAYQDREDPFVAACLSGDPAAAVRLAEDTDVSTRAASRPLLLAEVAGLRHWGVVRLLVDIGFEVNAGSPSPLHYAAAAGAVDEARLLVDHGADPTATDARFGISPAGWADYFHHADLAEYLRSRAG